MLAGGIMEKREQKRLQRLAEEKPAISPQAATRDAA
jgi:hypothetical protein